MPCTCKVGQMLHMARVKIYLDSIDSSPTIFLKNGEKASPSKLFSTGASELEALVRALVGNNEKLSTIHGSEMRT